MGPVIAATLLALQWGWNSDYLTWSLLSIPLLIGFAVVFSPQLPRNATGEDEGTSRLVPSAIGFLVSLSILGVALFPWLAGVLAQSAGIWSLLPYTVMLTSLMFVSWWVIFRGLTKKLRPVE